MVLSWSSRFSADLIFAYRFGTVKLSTPF